MSMKMALLAHLLGVIVWVGGMFFAHIALRPAAAELLQPAQRLPLLAGALGRFFKWVAWSIVLILVTINIAIIVYRRSMHCRLRTMKKIYFLPCN